MTLTGIYQYDKFDGLSAVDTDLNNHPLYGDLNQHTLYPEPGVSTTSVVNLAVKYSLPFATLESSTSYSQNATNGTLDESLVLGVLLPGSPGYTSSLPDNDRSFVQEVRLVSSTPGPLKWVVGGYYQNAGRT